MRAAQSFRTIVGITALVALIGAGGCDSGGENNDFFLVQVGQVTVDNADRVLPDGPDAVGGVGDFFISNGQVTVIIDNVDQDPTTGDADPIQSTAGQSGGFIIDLASFPALDDDQLNQNIHGFLGIDIGDPLDPNDDAIISPFFLVARYTQIEIVRKQADRSVIRATGVILSTDAGNNFNQGGGIPTGGAVDTGVQGNFQQINFGADIDFGDDLLNEPVLVNAGTGLPIVIRTDYSLALEDRFIDSTTSVFNPGDQDLFIQLVVDAIITGGNNDKFSPPAGLGGIDALNAQIVGATGDVADAQLQFLTPFVALSGNDEPAVSYALFDQLIGQVVELAGGGDTVAIAAGVNGDAFIPAGAAGPGALQGHKRQLAVGRRGDVGSAIDEAVIRMGIQFVRDVDQDGDGQADVVFPNSIVDFGTVVGATNPPRPGARVVIIQEDPGVFFDGVNIQEFLDGNLVNTEAFFANFPAAAGGTVDTGVEHVFCETVTDSTGSFRAVLPDGDYRAEVTDVQPTNNNFDTVDFTIRKNIQTNVSVNLDAVGTIAFDVDEDLGGGNLADTPVKLTFVGQGGTPSPNFGVLQRAAGVGNIVLDADGEGRVTLPDGTYDVIATRGIEFTAAIAQNVNVNANQVTDVDLIIERVLDVNGATLTDGFLSVDTHIHSGRSFDSQVPLKDRVVSALANGLEVMISTDHDVISDYGPTIAALDVQLQNRVNVQGQITSFIGEESTGFVFPNNIDGTPLYPLGIGHFNAWPMSFQADQRKRGAVQDEFRSPGVLFDTIRNDVFVQADLLTPIIQLNHARAATDPISASLLGRAQNTFETLILDLALATGGAVNIGQGTNPAASQAPGFDLLSAPLTVVDIGLINNIALSGSPLGTTNLDFDVIELFNGAQTDPTEDLGRDPTGVLGITSLLSEMQTIRGDWFQLLNANFPRTATATSDSHSVQDGDGVAQSEAIGVPRTYFRSNVVDLSTLDVNDMNAALLQEVKDGGVVNGNDAFNGEVFGTSGPMIIVEVDVNQDGVADGTLGDFVQDDGDGIVDLFIAVRAAPWVPIDNIRIICNGGGQPGVDASANGVAPDPIDATDGAFVFPDVPDVATPADPFSNDPNDTIRYLRNAANPLTIDFNNFLGAGNGLPAGVDAWIIVEASSNVSANGFFGPLGDPALGSTGSILDFDGDGRAEIAGVFDTLSQVVVAPPDTTGDTDDGIYNDIYPGQIPFGFSNPIFIDLNNDGDFDSLN